MSQYIFVFDSLEPVRLDAFLVSRDLGVTRSSIARHIDEGLVTVNGVIASKGGIKLKNADRIGYLLPPPQSVGLAPEDIPLAIVYEDEDILVLDKPAGLTVHPARGAHNHTLVNGLLHYLGALSTIGGFFRPGIVHRLDKQTSGLMVVAKNDRAHAHLSAQFKDKSISREYLALVCGALPFASKTIVSMIGRNPRNRLAMSSRAPQGKEAVTTITRVSASDGISLIHARLATGRTHQIRVHLSEAGYPVIGDVIYGNKASYDRIASPRLRAMARAIEHNCLHAFKLTLLHPVANERLSFAAPMPEYMKKPLYEAFASDRASLTERLMEHGYTFTD